MNQGFLHRFRYYAIGICVCLSFACVWGRLYYLHVVDAPNLALQAQETRTLFKRLEHRRGNVLDRAGNILATTQQVFVLAVDPEHFNQHKDKLREGALADLADLLDVSLDELTPQFEQGAFIAKDGTRRPDRWNKLKDEIDPELYRKVLELNIPGVYGTERYRRTYPGGQLAAHVLGYTNKEGVAVTGVEWALDFYLSGQDGWLETEKDGRRRELAEFRCREIRPVNGHDVQLTLDIVVQSVVEQSIAQLVESYKPDGISILVSDPHTGRILAMANHPSYDPNTYWEFPLERQRNRAVTDLYEPGSTFKIVAVSGALNEGLVNPATIINCKDSVVEYRGHKIRLPRDHKVMEMEPLRQVIAQSSNHGAAQIGMMLGEDRLYEYAQRFGFGQRSGFLLSNEQPGTLHNPKNWDILTLSRMSAGYAVNATPMQVHYAMAAIANNGILMEPQLVERITDESGQLLAQFQPSERGRVVSARTAHSMSEMLARVTVEGTGKNAAIPGFEVAGKTGTTRKINENGQYVESAHVASFSGFFPASDPQVVITVVVDNARLPGPAYGGVVAAPVFREIGQRLTAHLAIQPPVSQPDQFFAHASVSPSF